MYLIICKSFKFTFAEQVIMKSHKDHIDALRYIAELCGKDRF
jgi:hypothetical protein